MARRTKYAPDVVQRVVQAIDMGATYELAAAYAGVSPSTLYTWIQSKPEFLEAIKSAEGRAAVKWLAKIEQAASDGTWQAAAWKLERRYPHDYGKTVQDVNAKVDGEVSVTLVRKG